MMFSTCVSALMQMSKSVPDSDAKRVPAAAHVILRIVILIGVQADLGRPVDDRDRIVVVVFEGAHGSDVRVPASSDRFSKPLLI